MRAQTARRYGGIVSLLLGLILAMLGIIWTGSLIGSLFAIQPQPVPGVFDVDLDAGRSYAIVVEQEQDDPSAPAVPLSVRSISVTDPAGAPVALETDALDRLLVPTGTAATFEPTSDGRHEVTVDSAEVGIATVTLTEPVGVFRDFASSVWPLLLAVQFLLLGVVLLVTDSVLRRRRARPLPPAPAVPQTPSTGSPSLPESTRLVGQARPMSRRAYWAGLLTLGFGLGLIIVNLMLLNARLGTIATVDGPGSFAVVLEDDLVYDLEVVFEDEGPNQLFFGIADIPGSRELVVIGPDGVERMRTRGLFGSRSNDTVAVDLGLLRSDQAGRYEFILDSDRPMTVRIARTSIQQVGDFVPFLLVFFGVALVLVGIVVLAIGWVRARRSPPPSPMASPLPASTHQPPPPMQPPPPTGPNPT
jgi:hypothetical protein